jgi:hypothetical protein
MSQKTSSKPPDYMVIGHLTRDLLHNGSRLGGSTAYCSLTAKQLGVDVAIFTICDQDLDLQPLADIKIHCQVADCTTTFQNKYSAGRRAQQLIARAPTMDLNQLPDRWKKSRIIHFAPVANEIPLGSIGKFQDSMLFFSLQGWLRVWDEEGVVKPTHFPDMPLLPNPPAGGFLSIEDLGYNRDQLDHLKDIFPILILTHGVDGVEMYQANKRIHVPAPPTVEFDPTGAGDIFATAFIIENVINERSSLDAVRFASALAALSTTRPGLAGIPSGDEIRELREVR